MLTPSQRKRAAHKQKFEAVRNELAEMNQLAWMARRGELLAPHPTPVDDGQLSSHLFGPVMKTVQMQRVRVIVDSEDEMEDWNDRQPIN